MIGADGEGRKKIISVRRLTAKISYSNIPLAADIVCLRRDRDCLMISGDVWLDGHHRSSDEAPHQDQLCQEGRLWGDGAERCNQPPDCSGGATSRDHRQDPPLHEFQGDLCRQTRLQETQWALCCPTELNFSKTAKPNVGQIPDYQGKIFISFFNF